jgi:putative DNA primase/helicase
MTLLETALTLHREGYTPLPIKPDGTKSPAVRWTPYIDTQPTIAEVTGWFTRIEADGIGVIAGAASGNLEMFEAEGRAIHLIPQLAQLMTDHDAAELWALINSGWVEITPNAGMHWHYRVSDGPARRNTKLARRPATDTELADKPDEKIKVLFETRGQGGFTVLAPSNGRTHPTGKGWRRVHGGPDTCPVITSEQRDLLYAVTSLLDETPTEPEPAYREPGPVPAVGGLRPGDDYNARASWDDILGSRGWEKQPRPGFVAWRRPGKTDPGISATTGRNEHDRLYVFSSSTEFDTEKPYSKFAAYALLEHGGNYADAARALRRAGYGPEPGNVVPLTQLIAGVRPVTGQLATVTSLPAPNPAPPTARTLDRSDDGNALRLVDTYGDRIRYCPDRSRWLIWDGVRWHWQESGGGAIRELAKHIARSLPDTDSSALTHKRRSLGAVGTSAMLVQAATDQRITIRIGELDAHPWELNTPAGILDLRTGELMPADPTRLHTRTTLCPVDPDADMSRWEAFLADTFGHDAALISYLQRLVGYSAIGLVGPHVLPFCHGSGGNGKGVFLESVQKVLHDYATAAPAGFLMATAYASHETEIARLAGARMVICSEVNEDDRFDEAKVKQLTGGDTLTARFMRQDHFTFVPTHQLWLMGNSQPAVRSGGRAFWRRLRLIPFEQEVPDEKLVDDLQGIMAREHGPALLAWIVAGAVEYAKNGLQEPASVKSATAEYAHDQDTVARFLEERCILGGGQAVLLKASIVRAAYERWCVDVGEQPVTTKAFGLALRRRGVDFTRSKTSRFYVGITLVGDENASPDGDADDRDGGRYR